MLSERYRNVTTDRQEGEYKVIIFITIALKLKKLIPTIIKTVVHIVTAHKFTLLRHLFTI